MSQEKPTEAASSALLNGFTRDQWQRFLGYTEVERFREGDFLIVQGQIDRTLYVLLNGHLDVHVTRGPDRVRTSIDRLSPGAAFGEMAFFDLSPRSASVQALTDGALLCLRPEAVELMRSREPDLACALTLELGRALSLRFRRFLAG